MTNSVDIATNLINRAMNLQEFTVTTDLPENFRFTGKVPYDIVITDDKITLKIHAVNLQEATDRAMEYLESQQ